MGARMDAVLPVTHRDLARAEILCRSLALRFADLGTLWVVCPDAERAAVERDLARSRFAPRARVLSELDVVPELALRVARPAGWFRQQLVKLAIAEHVETPFYLTLDADVVCTRSVTSADLAPNGKAVCHIVNAALHPDWYADSEAFLGLASPRRAITHNVTPVVLARAAVFELRDFLQGLPPRPGLRGGRQRLALARAALHRAGSLARWRLMLAAGTPWTEYGVYYTFLEAKARFDSHHVLTASPICDPFSIWRADKDRFDEWDPAPSFDGPGPPYFLVIQSNTRIAVDRVWRKLEPHLE